MGGLFTLTYVAIYDEIGLDKIYGMGAGGATEAEIILVRRLQPFNQGVRRKSLENHWFSRRGGGDERDRTADLLNAMAP